MPTKIGPLGVCSHCGAAWDDAHEQGYCGVAAATQSILANYQPRGMTARFDCPNGDGDGIWKWGPQSKSFECMKCGVLVDPHTGAKLADLPKPFDQDALQDIHISKRWWQKLAIWRS